MMALLYLNYKEKRRKMKKLVKKIVQILRCQPSLLSFGLVLHEIMPTFRVKNYFKNNIALDMANPLSVPSSEHTRSDP